MAPISINQLMEIVERQDKRIASLQNQINNLKSWSDLNDNYLQEMIDSNTTAMDHLRTVINDMHDADIINRKLEKLEKQEETPVAQLLKEFIEENATVEEKEELNYPTICNH